MFKSDDERPTVDSLGCCDRKARSAVFNSKEGMLFIAALIEECGVLSNSYYAYQGNNTADCAYKEGRRSVGLGLLYDIYGDSRLEKEYHMAVEQRNQARRNDVKITKNFEPEGDVF